MAFDFRGAYNKFAKGTTALNREVNKVIGKDVFQDVKEIEAPREFAPYSSFAEYSVSEPAQWSPLTGTAKEFSLDGNTLSVSANLDACMQYRELFKTSARYYADRFEYKYKECVQDFDTLIHYFTEMYIEGLTPMIYRAYSVLLSFGVVNADAQIMTSRHIDTYKRAITSYEIMSGIEVSRQEMANSLGNQVGNSVHMQGGGFGLKGAMKGVAQAEAINLAIGALGKFVEIQSQMSKEEKANVYSKFNQELFFEEVYSDYFNTFMTMITFLVENNELDNISVIVGNDYNVMIQNLQNPMFPNDKVVPSIIKLISTYPFETKNFELLQEKLGQTEEVNQIMQYFIG